MMLAPNHDFDDDVNRAHEWPLVRTGQGSSQVDYHGSGDVVGCALIITAFVGLGVLLAWLLF